MTEAHSSTNLQIPDDLRASWAELLNTIADLLDVPVALIMRVHQEEIEVFSRSTGKENLYHQGEMASLGTGLYCETVMATRAELFVPHALKDPEWDHNPDIKLGYINYLGYPVTWPDGTIFGTICVLDSKEHHYSDLQRRVLQQYQGFIQKELSSQLRQQELHTSHQKLELLFDNAIDAFFYHDIEGNIITVNRKAQEMFGYSEEGLLKMKPWDLLAPEYLEGRPDRTRKIIEEKELCFRSVFLHRDGTRIPAEVASSLVENGTNKAIFSVVRPLSSRLLPEEELLDAERNLREAQRIGKLGNWTWDYTKDSIEIADEIYRIFGYHQEDEIDLAALLEKHIHPDDIERVTEEMLTKFQRRYAFRTEFRIITNDMRERYIYVKGEPILAPNGNALRFVGIVADVTDRYHQQKEIQKSQDRFRELVEDLGVNYMVYRRHLDGTLVYVSPGIEALYGIPASEATGKVLHSLVNWDEESQAEIVRVREQLESGIPVTDHDLAFTTADGERRDVRVSAHAVRDENGEIVFIDGITTNITEEKKRQRELKESHERFRDLIEDLGDNYLVFRYTYPDGIVLYASPGLRAIFGVDPDDAIGASFYNAVNWTPETRALFAEIMPNLQPGNRVNDLEQSFIHPDGTVRTIALSAHAIGNDRGKVTHVDGIIRDITEEKERQREVEESHRRFKQLTEDLGNNYMVYRRTPDGVLTYISPSCEALMGITEEEAIGSNVRDVIEWCEDSHQVLSSNAERLAHGEDVIEQEASFRRKDGEIRHISICVHNVYDEHGNVAYMDGIVRDTTDEKRQQRDLEASHRRFKELIEDLGDNYVVYRRGLDGTTLYASPGSEAVVGVRPEDAIGKDLFSLFDWTEASRAALPEATAKLMAEGQLADLELSFTSASGELVDVSVNTHCVYDESGMPLYIDGIVRNITKEKRQQRELEESHRRFKELVEDLGDNYMVYRRKPDGTLVYLSPGSEKILGIADDALGKNNREALEWVGESKTLADRNAAQLAEGKRIVDAEGCYRHKDGSLRYMSMNAHNVYDDAGNVIFVDGLTRDITEEKRRQQELEESRERFRQLVEDLGDTYVVFSYTYPDGKLSYVSSGMSSVFGLDAESATGKSFYDIIQWTPETIELFGELLPKMRPGDSIGELEESFIHPDGAVRYISVSAHVIGDENGEVSYVNGIAHDITAEKHRSDEIEAVLARFRGMVEDLGDRYVVYRHTPDLKMVYVSPGSATVFGIDPEAAIGKNYMELVDWTVDTRERQAADHQSLIEHGSIESSEHSFRHADGSIRYISVSGHIVLNDNGMPEYIDGIVADITDRKRMELALKESEERFDLAIAAADEGIYDLDVQSGKVYYSPRWKEMLGYTEDEIPNTYEAANSLLHPDDVERIRESLTKNRASTGTRFSFEHRLRHKNGTYRIIQSRYIIVRDDEGKPVRVTGTNTDVTAQREMERALQKSEERFDLAVAATNEGIWDVDLVTNSAYYSPRWKEMLGYHPDELPNVNETWLGLIHPDDRQAAIAEVIRLQNEGAERINMEFRMRHKNGEWRNINARGIIIRDEDGRPVRRIGTHQDITEQRDLERQLRLSEERLKEAQRVAHIGSWAIILPERDIEFSEECLRLFGYEPGEVSPNFNDYLNHVHPDDREYVLHVQNPANGTPEVVEYRIIRKDGEVRDLRSIRKFVFDDNGNLLRLYGTMQDITKQKRLQSALEESEQRFNLAVKATRDGIWDVDVQTNTIYYSPRVREMLGYSESEWEDTWETWQKYLHPEDLERIWEEYRTALESQVDRFTMQSRFRHRNGEYRSFISNGVIVRDENGTAIRATGTHTDITERLELEDRLMIFQKLVEASGQGFAIAGLDRTIVYANPTLARLVGMIDPGELMGESTAQFYPSHIKPKLRDEIMPVLMESGSWTGELEILSTDGSTHHTLENLFIIRDEAGNPQYIADVITPIDEIKRNEEQLKIFREFADQSGQGFAMATLEGITVYINSTMADLLEVEVGSEYIGAYEATVCIDGKTESIRERILPTLVEDGQWTGETAITTASGKTIHAIENFFLIRDEKGNPRYIGDVITPIEEMKEKEAQLEEARRAAEAASEAKSQFLANMSHEIRTPLNAIIGMSHLALNTEVTPKQRHYLNSIDQAGRTLRDIISSVLDFSKIEAGKLEITKDRFALEPVLQQIVEMHIIDAAEKRIEINADIDLDIPAFLIGDSLRLTQVLNNLLHNAVKFTEEGEVCLDVRLLRIDRTHTEVEFEVRDTGIGMTEGQMKNLFQVFSQADGSITRRYGGNGLGLAICKRLVELMGGTISVQSRAQEGTSFKVVVPFPVGSEHVGDGPVGDGPAETQHYALTGGTEFKVRLPFGLPPGGEKHTLNEEITDSLRGKRVLLVDDSEHARNAGTLMLGQAGIEVTCLSSGPDALAFLEPSAGNVSEFDLVIIDLDMAGMNGLEFAAQLQERHIGHPPMLLATTVYWRDQILARAIEKGFAGLIMKPMFPKAMSKALLEALSPAKVRPAAELRQDQMLGDGKLNGSILLVEDNVINQEVVQELLNNLGLEVTLARDGSEAVVMIRRRQFDAVLMDVQMPKMDGLTATRFIRGMDLDFAKDIPIIAMTAHALEGDREKCMEAGMNDYISKPIDPEYLISLMMKWVSGMQAGTKNSTDRKVSAANNAWIKNLEDHGVNAVHSLRQIGGNTEFYLRMLRKFTDEYASVPGRIDKLLHTGDIESALNEAHSLKNVAGYIGAKSMWESLVRLNKALKENYPTVDAVLDDFTNEMTALVAVLRNTLQLIESSRN